MENESEGLETNMKAMLNTAVVVFQQEWGQKIRECRKEVADMSGRDIDVLAQMLTLMEITLSPEELAQIEEGTFTNIDIRLIIAIWMALEVNVDSIILSALRQSAQQHEI